MKNFIDEELGRRWFLKPEEVREVEKEVLVDTGATMLTVPEEVVEELVLTRGHIHYSKLRRWDEKVETNRKRD